MADEPQRRIHRAPSLTEQVTASLRRDIVGGVHAPGGTLPSEQAMAQGFGVSRTVMREAISRLKADGLVVTRQGLGAFVSPSPNLRPFRIDASASDDVASVVRIVELRKAMEIEASALAALRHDREDLREMRAALANMERAVETGDVGHGVTSDFRFHRAVYAATRNEYFSGFFDFISQFLRRSLELSRQHSARDKAIEQAAQHEHADILEGVASGDPDRARAAARVHVENTTRRILARPATAPASPAAVATA